MKIFVLCLSALFIAFSAFAETYTWTDSQGNVNFTDDLGNVPPKYRKKAKILGEEEMPPAEAEQKPSAKGKDEGAAEKGLGAKTPSPEKAKALYGGKSAEAWKQEYGQLDGDLKFVEKQLDETRSRLSDTSNMSRAEYLSLQNQIKSLESRISMRQQKLEEFRGEADRAGVPPEILQ